MSKIIIHLEGGIIGWQAIMPDKDKKVTGIIIVDTDTEDSGNEIGLVTITDSNDQKVSAYITEEPIYDYNKKSDLGHFVETYLDLEDIEMSSPEELPLLLHNMRTPEGENKIADLLRKGK